MARTLGSSIAISTGSTLCRSRSSSLSCSVKGIGGAGKLAASVSLKATESPESASRTDSVSGASLVPLDGTPLPGEARSPSPRAIPEGAIGTTFTPAISILERTGARPALRIAGIANARNNTPARAAPDINPQPNSLAANLPCGITSLIGIDRRQPDRACAARPSSPSRIRRSIPSGVSTSRSPASTRSIASSEFFIPHLLSPAALAAAP